MAKDVHDLILQNTLKLGHELAHDLTDIERSHDEAARKSMALAQKIMDRHRGAGISRVAVQPILAHLTRSVATAMDAAGEVVGAHIEIRKMGDRRGLKEVSWGDGLCDPRPASASTDEGVNGQQIAA